MKNKALLESPRKGHHSLHKHRSPQSMKFYFQTESQGRCPRSGAFWGKLTKEVAHILKNQLRANPIFEKPPYGH